MDLLRNGRKRVVITGAAGITNLGNLDDMWDALIEGKSGIRKIQNIDPSNLSVKIGGEIPDFSSADYIPQKDRRRMGRASQLAIVATNHALNHASLSEGDIDKYGERMSIMIGTSLGPQEQSEIVTTKYRTDGGRPPVPVGLINSLPNMPAFYISQYFRVLGLFNTITASCASGTQAVGMAADLIRTNRADIVITGAVEALMSDYMIAAFTALKALATDYNEAPAKASRPFTLNRQGFVLSEGCSIFVVESLAHAKRRKVPILAEILGYASSADAYHLAAIDPEGKGAVRSMQWALDDAHINASEVDYINAHGTSTVDNDRIETKAIKQVFGKKASSIPINSTKSMMGHALGASGAIEIAVCIKTLQNQLIHPTINYDIPDPECDLDYVPNTARAMNNIKIALSNSFGLGGQNASIVIGAT